MGWTALQLLALAPVLGGSVYALLCVWAAARMFPRTPRPPPKEPAVWPGVTVLKPVHGLEKNLLANLRSACLQDYPDYQVVFSLQRLDDPALPIARAVQAEFGSDRVTLAVEESPPVVNGKIQNLLIGLAEARYEVLVISDSDVLLEPDYLRTIVAPLEDTEVGCVCTLYRQAMAEHWFERCELLAINSDFLFDLVFAAVTGASTFCLGATIALRRSTLEEIGGLEPLGEFLVEDFEMGRRIEAAGHRFVLVPYFVHTIVGLERASEWWAHQVYWDQNTRAARPKGFLASVLVKPIPFALLFAALRFFDPVGLAVLGATVALRTATVWLVLRRTGDAEGLASLWLVPLRDTVGLGSWCVAMLKRSFVWRGLEFGLTRDGRIVPREGRR